MDIADVIDLTTVFTNFAFILRTIVKIGTLAVKLCHPDCEFQPQAGSIELTPLNVKY